jgi:hypothetical protein
MILRAIVAQLLWSGGCPLDRKEMNISSDRAIRQSDPASDIKPQVADVRQTCGAEQVEHVLQNSVACSRVGEVYFQLAASCSTIDGIQMTSACPDVSERRSYRGGPRHCFFSRGSIELKSAFDLRDDIARNWASGTSPVIVAWLRW